MGKLDEMRRGAGANVGESMGAGRVPGQAMHGAYAPFAGVPARLQGITKSRHAADIPVDRITPDPDQPREEFDRAGLERLAESLKSRGQLQPIRVRWDEGRGSYAIVCGERRWRAAVMAGLPTMSCVIVDRPLSAGELLAAQLVENALREDLRPIEQARAFRALMEANGWTATQVGRELSIDQSSVSRALALLELPEAVQDAVEQGALPPATAYEVSKLDDVDAQREVAERVISEGLSRSETIEAVKRAATRSAHSKGRGAGRGKPRKVTERTFRVEGYRVTVECRRGIDDATLAAALRAVLDQVEPRTTGEAA